MLKLQQISAVFDTIPFSVMTELLSWAEETLRAVGMPNSARRAFLAPGLNPDWHSLLHNAYKTITLALLFCDPAQQAEKQDMILSHRQPIRPKVRFGRKRRRKRRHRLDSSSSSSEAEVKFFSNKTGEQQEEHTEETQGEKVDQDEEATQQAPFADEEAEEAEEDEEDDEQEDEEADLQRRSLAHRARSFIDDEADKDSPVEDAGSCDDDQDLSDFIDHRSLSEIEADEHDDEKKQH